MRVKSKSTIVPGGASSNGKEIAIIFAREYAKLTIADFEPKAGDPAVSKINPTDQRIVGVARDVSRGPEREGLPILEKESVVRKLPNRGAHVTQLSVKEADDIFEVHRTLFGAMIGRLTVPEAFALATAIDAEIQALDALARDPDGGAACFQTNLRLSRILCDACGNDRMAEILGSLVRQTLPCTRLGLARPGGRKEAARNWRTLQKALKAGTLDAAVNAAKKLIEDSRREGIKQLEARQAAARPQRLNCV
jgi:DNA-binding GntR family transcriptional regulator